MQPPHCLRIAKPPRGCKEQAMTYPEKFQVVEAWVNTAWVSVFWDGQGWRFFHTRQTIETAITHWRPLIGLKVTHD
jgi:hypothetical protein